MNRAKKFLANTAGFLEIPGDILAGMPKMELTGFREFSIEAHQGLMEYDKAQITIDTGVGRVNLLGRELTIRLMNSNRITICGDLYALELQEGCCD